jgi:multiple sugar transport system permease protein
MSAVTVEQHVTRTNVGVGGKRLHRILLFWVPIALFIVVTLFPFYWMALASVKANQELYNLQAFPFWAFNITGDHYAYLFREGSFFPRWMLNTTLVAVASTTISLTFSVLAGYALARLRFAGAGILGLLIFVSYLVPQTLLFIPLFDVIKTLGIADTYWALILTYPTFLIPFCSWLLMGYFKSIPKELEESAMIDGSSRVGTLVRIVLPLATPGLLSAGIFAFTLSWNEFIYSLVFITTTPMKTVPVGVTTELIRGDVFFWGSLMAGALMASVPVALAYSFLVDYYVAGLTAGAVKG